jgi:hypothetical protein
MNDNGRLRPEETRCATELLRAVRETRNDAHGPAALGVQDAARLADSAEVWYAYDPATSAMSYAWSGDEERTGAVRRYVVGETMGRDALLLACRNAGGSSRFYMSRSDAADHLAASRGWSDPSFSTPGTVTDSIISAPQLALFSNE